ncbi:PDR/VanB family oxidoreductase [Streptosporangium sp. NPDC051022]|uniref:PDR/VanB family oxidoreductase n=1 Tax=Streptosporangium sp. NPDC051022 TaxID=3155752 RepID=UPI00343AB9B2
MGIRREAAGIVSVTFDATGMPPWEPGAHLTLDLPNGLARQYSLCGADERDYTVAVLREPSGRGGSAYVHDELRVGDRIGVRGPRNNFPLVQAPSYLFVAGGVGITPILSMLSALSALPAPSGASVEWRLAYGGRTRDSMAFLDRLAPYGSRVLVRPEDEAGLLDLDALLDLPPETVVYCCGPAPLLDAVAERCRNELRVERFAGTGFRPGDPFEVECANAGVTLRVGAGQTILEAVEEAGIAWEYDCRDGTCGTCETRVLAGAVDHRDHLLGPAERETRMMICVSRAACERLVLEI